jgi:hypothetical protein
MNSESTTHIVCRCPVGYQHRLDIRSYIDTAPMHAMDVLHDLILGRPRRPPAHAFSP